MKERKELAEKERKDTEGEKEREAEQKRGNASNEVEKASTHFTHGIFVIFTSGFVSS